MISHALVTVDASELSGDQVGVGQHPIAGDLEFNKVPVYASGLVPGTGVIGQLIAISDSTPGGKMAYWDTTNSRWSYVSDDSAV